MIQATHFPSLFGTWPVMVHDMATSVSLHSPFVGSKFVLPVNVEAHFVTTWPEAQAPPVGALLSSHAEALELGGQEPANVIDSAHL